MENQTTATDERVEFALVHDLGHFEGFNFRQQEAIDDILSAEQMVNWNHDKDGEAEFWPAGDCPGVSLIFEAQSSVTCGEILALDALLAELGNDDEHTYLRINHTLSYHGQSVRELTSDQVEDTFAQIFTGDSFISLRSDAAYELFEAYYPDAYAAWEKSLFDGLIFDVDRFLDSPSWSVEEVTIGDVKALIVSPQ